MLTLKAVIIGDSGVGKSNFLHRLIYNKFESLYVSTIGVDYFNKFLTHRNQDLKLQIWDTSGQERFRTITSSYYRNTQIYFIAFDFLDRESLNHVDMWLQEIERYRNPESVIILLGMKADSKVIAESEVNRLAQYYQIPWFPCSAKDNWGVEDALIGALDCYFNQNLKIAESGIRLVPLPEKKERCSSC